MQADKHIAQRNPTTVRVRLRRRFYRARRRGDEEAMDAIAEQMTIMKMETEGRHEV